MLNNLQWYLWLVLAIGAVHCTAQESTHAEYLYADILFQQQHFGQSFRILRELEPKCNKDDTFLYKRILWDYTCSASFLEKDFRDHEQFDSALYYSLASLELIRKGIPFFDKKFAAREYWMVKNIVVAYFGLNQFEKADQYKAMLYQAYKNGTLPDGIDKYFNYNYFKWKDKNIWGYEWFEELPDDRFSKSFTKVVYYVYSTNPDGTDKDQLYRLHVLMFHKIDSDVNFDYVLTKYKTTEKGEGSRTLFNYTYTKNIDYHKLLADVKEILEKDDQ